MKPCRLLLLGFVGLASFRAPAQTGAAPRQLGAPPSAPPPALPSAPPPAPRQLEQVPAAVATRSAAAPADSAGQPPVPTPLAPGNAPGRGPGVRYQVGLKNGAVYGARDVVQKSPLFGHSFLLLDGQQRLELDQVRFYEDATGHYLRARPTGNLREITLRRAEAGRLSLYEPKDILFSQLVLGGTALALGGFGTAAALPLGYRRGLPPYFTKDDGPVQHLNHHDLRRAILDNPGVLTVESRAHRAETGNTVALVVGSGMLLAGLVGVATQVGGGWGNAGGRLTAGLLLGSLPVLAVPLVFRSRPANYRHRAIVLYNSQ